MSLYANIEHLVHASGILAVSVVGEDRNFRGDLGWAPILDASLELLDKTDESSLRLVIGRHTVVLQVESGERVGVVIATGDPIAKSLRRMIRRMARRVRPPLRAPAPSEVALAVSPMTPSAPSLVAVNAIGQ
jgi:hypothetical protein